MAERQMTDERAAYLNMGVGAILNATCWLLCSFAAVYVESDWLVFIAIVLAPAIMAIIWGAKTATFAGFLSFAYFIGYLFMLSSFDDSLGAFMVLSVVGWFASLLWLSLMGRKQEGTKELPGREEFENSGCGYCSGDGQIHEPTKWLDVPYTGLCYVCLGQIKVDKNHPNYEAYLLLNKYQDNLLQTRKEYLLLNRTCKEFAEQKKQGPTALGEALYQETLALENEYREQAELRQAQLDLFDNGIRRLHRQMYNSKLAEHILNKRKELAGLKDGNTDDLATSIALKEQLIAHYGVLDRINALTAEAEMYKGSNITRALIAEIEQLQREL